MATIIPMSTTATEEVVETQPEKLQCAGICKYAKLSIDVSQHRNLSNKNHRPVIKIEENKEKKEVPKRSKYSSQICDFKWGF